MWSSYLFYGNLKGTCHHADRALEIYETEHHRDQAMRFGGHDVCECGLINSGNALFAMGYAEQAMKRNIRGLQHAMSLEHPQIVGHSYNWAIILPQQLDDLNTLSERINYIIPIIEKIRPGDLFHRSSASQSLARGQDRR